MHQFFELSVKKISMKTFLTKFLLKKNIFINPNKFRRKLSDKLIDNIK